jgi:hypothetical protein
MNSILPFGFFDKNFYNNARNDMSLIVCDECKFEWVTKDTIFFEEEYSDKNLNKYFVLSFRCEQCGKEYLISVNNSETLLEIKNLRRIEKQFLKLQKKVKGKPTPKQSSNIIELFEKRKRLIRRIGNHQNSLKEKFLCVKNDLIITNYVENKK